MKIQLDTKSLNELKQILQKMLGDAFNDLSEEDINLLGVRLLKITYTLHKKTS